MLSFLNLKVGGTLEFTIGKHWEAKNVLKSPAFSG